jgi:secondary thiamine-phosphate synthase enzyme
MQLEVKTTQKRQVIDITNDIQDLITSKKISDAISVIIVLHTTVSITTANLDAGGTDLDYLDFLSAITPKLRYRHPHDPEHVPDHILASIIGSSLTLLVEDGKLQLGTWQRVVLIELDGPRTRKLVLKILAAQK